MDINDLVQAGKAEQESEKQRREEFDAAFRGLQKLVDEINNRYRSLGRSVTVEVKGSTGNDNAAQQRSAGRAAGPSGGSSAPARNNPPSLKDEAAKLLRQGKSDKEALEALRKHPSNPAPADIAAAVKAAQEEVGNA